jgi:hypothetical protein
MSAATRPSAPPAPGLSPGWSLALGIALASRNATLATAA